MQDEEIPQFCFFRKGRKTNRETETKETLSVSFLSLHNVNKKSMYLNAQNERRFSFQVAKKVLGSLVLF